MSIAAGTGKVILVLVLELTWGRRKTRLSGEISQPYQVSTNLDFLTTPHPPACTSAPTQRLHVVWMLTTPLGSATARRKRSGSRSISRLLTCATILTCGLGARVRIPAIAYMSASSRCSFSSACSSAQRDCSRVSSLYIKHGLHVGVENESVIEFRVAKPEGLMFCVTRRVAPMQMRRLVRFSYAARDEGLTAGYARR